MDPKHTTYRGYVLVTNELGTDIWSGAEYLTTVHRGAGNLEGAQRIVDEWLDAR